MKLTYKFLTKSTSRPIITPISRFLLFALSAFIVDLFDIIILYANSYVNTENAAHMLTMPELYPAPISGKILFSINFSKTTLSQTEEVIHFAISLSSG